MTRGMRIAARFKGRRFGSPVPGRRELVLQSRLVVSLAVVLLLVLSGVTVSDGRATWAPASLAISALQDDDSDTDTADDDDEDTDSDTDSDTDGDDDTDTDSDSDSDT